MVVSAYDRFPFPLHFAIGSRIVKQIDVRDNSQGLKLIEAIENAYAQEGTANRFRSIREEIHRFEGNGSTENVSVDEKISSTNSQAAVASTIHHNINVCAVKHHFRSPVVSWIEDSALAGQISHVTNSGLKNEHLETEPSCSESTTANAARAMHISGRLMEEFMELAKGNTSEDLETCGILGASFTNQTFYVTTLLVPKQETTAHSCQALNEEEIHAILHKQSLFPAGWIHTHPSQTCFLSSIDLHTQYSYQIMLPEAIAIVMAPTDPKRKYGIFRLTDPGGIQVLRECKESGFHSHRQTDDGSPLYENSSNIYINPNLRFEIIDLRTS